MAESALKIENTNFFQVVFRLKSPSGKILPLVKATFLYLIILVIMYCYMKNRKYLYIKMKIFRDLSFMQSQTATESINSVL